MRVVTEPAHGLGFTGDADAGGRVQTLCFDDGQCYVAVEDGVVRLVDPLAPTFPE